MHVAVGDIHGCFDELLLLMTKLKEYHNREDVTWVFLGDYVDRGPNVSGVIDYLIEFSKKNYCVFLMGNHDCDFFINRYSHREGMGGVDNYGPKLSPEHESFFRKLHYKYETDDYFFVHAGIQPGVDLDFQNPNDLLWIRRNFLLSDRDHGKIVVHGHTVEDLFDPTVKHNRIGIDTGCVFGGRLTAAVIDDWETKFVQIDSRFNFDD